VFGSRANGSARRSSDLDLAISSPEATPTEWAELCDALLNTPIIYELDILRSEQIANERLKARIAREGVTIYRKKPNRRRGTPPCPLTDTRSIRCFSRAM
jgi:uncharacterized protein